MNIYIMAADKIGSFVSDRIERLVLEKPNGEMGAGCNHSDQPFTAGGKYTDFFVGNMNLIPGIAFPMPNLLLPIGISFYTFQILTYIIDLYRGKVNWQKNPM